MQCDGGFLFTHPPASSRRKAEPTANAFKSRQPQAMSSRKIPRVPYAMFGQFLTYDRIKGYLTIPNRPVLHQYRKLDSTVDTVSIKAQLRLTTKKNDFAQAFRNVVASQRIHRHLRHGLLRQKTQLDSAQRTPRCVASQTVHLTGFDVPRAGHRKRTSFPHSSSATRTARRHERRVRKPDQLHPKRSAILYMRNSKMTSLLSYT